jgi:hypothetical protein
MTDTNSAPTIWRTKLRSLKPGVNHVEQVAHNLDDGIVGIGWGLEDLPSRTPLDQVLAALEAKDEPGWGRRAMWTVRRFGRDAQVGDFVWTRDLAGRFRLGQLAGPYRYVNNAKAKRTDTHQVRRCGWARRPLGDLEVPGGIIRAFSGTSTSFERIHDEGARRYTAWLWDDLHGREPEPLTFTPAEVLAQLEPYDLEDLIYTWMQMRGGYLALPRARRTDTPAYEWTMLHRKTHRPAIVQVKSGRQSVDLEQLASAAPDAETALFAYSAAESYTGSPDHEVKRITTAELLKLVKRHPAVLPPRVRRWFELAKDS